MYDVSLGSIELYSVTDFEEENSRQIESYDGIGQGKFPIAENRNLRTWEIACELTEHPHRYNLSDWSSAKGIFKKLDRMMESTEPVQLIVGSKKINLSVRVLLESYNKKEIDEGAYEVTIRLKEFQEASIRSMDIPFPARPGKVPESETFVIPEGGNAYDAVVKKAKSSKLPIADVMKHCSVIDGNLKKYTNPILFPTSTKLTWVEDIRERKSLANEAVKGALSGGLYMLGHRASGPAAIQEAYDKVIKDMKNTGK